MNVTEAIAAWRSYRCTMVTLHLVAESTYDNQVAICLMLQRELGFHALAGLRKSHIELWAGKRLQTHAPVTVRGELNVLRQVIRWCIDEGHLTVGPRFPKVSVPNTESALPDDAAFLWVLANVPPQHAAALEFMMLTGLSPHELERLQVRDGMFGTGSDQYLAIGKRSDFAVKQPSRRRMIPMGARARQLWFEASAGRPPEAPLFPTVAAMQKAIRRAIDAPATVEDVQAGLPTGLAGITPKHMRKWFASKVANDQPEHVLQRLLGHAPGSPITRRHYVRSRDDQLSNAVEGVRA